MPASAPRFEVRLVDVELDLMRLVALHRETFPDDDFPSWSGWWWIASHEGQDVGFCGMHPSLRWSDTVFLVRAGVLPECQGNGLQKRMLRVREAHARRLGMKWAITYTMPDNHPSSNSLIGRGYRLYKPANPWVGTGVLYWRKRLNGGP